MQLNRYVQITGSVLATCSVLGILWAAADYAEVRPVLEKELVLVLETQQQLSENILLLRFQVLMNKKEKNSLSFQELQELCLIVRQLQYVGVSACNNMNR